jgi:hypothetical protein
MSSPASASIVTKPAAKLLVPSKAQRRRPGACWRALQQTGVGGSVGPVSGLVADPPGACREDGQVDRVAVRVTADDEVVKRPGRDQFFRVHSGQRLHARHTSLSTKETWNARRTLWPPLSAPPLADRVRKIRIFTAIDKRGNIFLWAVKLPAADGSASARSWHQSALHAAEQAKKLWIKIQGNKAIGAYDVIVAKGDLGDPSWPDYTLQELIKVAFRDRFIDSLDHPVVKELNGEI